MLFTSLNAVKELNDFYEEEKIDENMEKSGAHILGSEFFETFMILLGPKPKIPNDDYVKWTIFIVYAFLIVMVNLKLVIAVIGETYAK